MPPEEPKPGAKQPPASRFSRSYLAYLSALAAIVGPAAPLVIAFTRAIPVFDALSSLLGGLSFLFNATLVGLVMFWRHSLIRHIFRYHRGVWRTSPLLVTLLLCSLAAGVLFLSLYFSEWNSTYEELRNATAYKDINEADIPKQALLSNLPLRKLTIYYCGAFLSFQILFSIMALREYGQEVLRLSERNLIKIKDSIPKEKKENATK